MPVNYSIKAHIEPLAIAVNVAQEANTRCDQVLLLLANLYQVYTNIRRRDCTSAEWVGGEDEHPVSPIIESIEKRWEKADQDLFIAALFLNPFIKKSLVNG